MIEKNEKIVGIIGGMGPEATVDLMQRIIACTELSALDSLLPIKTVDAAQVLAMKIVQVAKNSPGVQ